MNSEANIRVVGVGGSGCNAVSRMMACKIQGVDLVIINTDLQDLKKAQAHHKLQIGRNLTEGLGVGMNPDLGRKAAEEQKEEIFSLLKGSDIVFITCGLGGGCLRGSSLVSTNPAGPTRIDSIKPGSTVYTFYNNALVKRKVLAAMKTGVKKILELKTRNRTIYASEDHPFLRVNPLHVLSNNRFSKFALQWIELKDLKIGDLVVVLRKLPDEGRALKLPDDSLVNEEFCQLFGFLLGDGWISKSKKSWKVYFSPSNDEQSNQKYLDLIKEIFGLHMKKTSSANWYYADSKKIYELLEGLGLNKPAKEKEIPKWVFTLPESQKKAFIVGLADADGSYSVQIGKAGLPKKEIKLEMSSEILIKGLKALCDGMGLRTSNISSRTRTLKPPNSKEEKMFTSWILRIYKTHELLGELPHPKARAGIGLLYKFRSRRPPEFFKHFGINRVESIKEIGNEEVYDITVEGSHNFIADGFVVHNTGSGAAPVVAEIAKKTGALVIAVVTKPFSFEGGFRRKIAQKALQNLKDKVDTLLSIPNDRLLDMINQDTSVASAFWTCDETLRQAVQGISDLIVLPGIVNVDFADIKTIMKDSGPALLGIGIATGERRAQEAANQAINSPLLDSSIQGGRAVLFNVSGGADMSLSEIKEIAKTITQKLNPHARVIFGAVEDKKLKKGELKVILIATGF